MRNVYIVFTEYQLLQAMNLATGMYSSFDFVNVIYIVRNGRRLNGLKSNEIDNLDNIKIVILDQKPLSEVAKEILNENPDHFFIFQGNSELNIYLGKSFSKKGVQVSLGPDGYGAYNIFDKKFPILTLIRDSVKGNRFLIQNKLYDGKLFWFDYYKYGSHTFIDNIWVTHPSKYVHSAKNKVKILGLPHFNERCITLIKSLFNFDENFPTTNAIYYFNQPLWGELVKKEFEFLEGVLNYFPDQKIIVKLHPLTSEEIKEKFRTYRRIHILESNVPAEVILLQLQNCIVYSGWSSVLITENNTCNYYFNYPIYKRLKDRVMEQSKISILDHIEMIDKPELMKFPDEQSK